MRVRKTHRTELQNQKAKRRDSICWERKSVMGSKRCAFEDPSEWFGEKKKKEEDEVLSVLATKKLKKLDLLNAFFLEREREEREWNGLVLYSFKHKGADSWTFKPYRLNHEQVLLIWTVTISTRGLFCSDFLLGLFFFKSSTDKLIFSLFLFHFFLFSFLTHLLKVIIRNMARGAFDLYFHSSDFTDNN